MEASELRLGNFVEVENYKIIQLENVHIKGTTKGDEQYLICMLQPIPLTEEWLVKFGFEKGTLIYKNDSFNFNGEIVFKGEDSFRYFGTNAKLKHVHTLQNLYFALTGQELTIKHN